MIEDRILIWKLKSGNREALCRIYENYRDDLLRIAAGLLSDRGEAEDVVQEVFADFLRILDRFTLTGSLRGYLTTCVANKARNVNRARARRVAAAMAIPPGGAAEADPPDRWIETTEEFDKLCGVMAQLPYEQRETVILHLQGDLKFREIAALQETSVKTVISRYRYGLSKLLYHYNGEVSK